MELIFDRHFQIIPQYLYIHYPLCKHVCSYCDFNVYSTKEIAPSSFDKKWLITLETHLNHFWGVHQKNNPLQTFYLGGGTPSLLSLKTLHQLFLILQKFYDFSQVKEITIECNPETLTKNYLKELKNLGFNRMSLGVQTFSSNQLRRLERLSTLKHLQQNIDCIATLFLNYSLDLMIGIPDQTFETLENDLRWLEKYKPPHCSVYLLTLQENHRWFRSSMQSHLVPSEESVLFYERASQFLEQLGYEHYEVSNFARLGFKSIHNQNYWNSSSDYLALGPGAHGYLKGKTRMRFKNILDPKTWASHPTGIEDIEFLNAKQQALEENYLKLRTKTGIPLNHLNSAGVETICRQGWGKTQEEQFWLTNQGWLRCDAIASCLLL